MALVQRDPKPRVTRQSRSPWLDLLNEVRQEGSGKWFVLHENVASQKFYDLRKKHGVEFEFDIESVDDPNETRQDRVVLFARLKK